MVLVSDFRPPTEAYGDWYDDHYDGRGLLVLDHIDDYQRSYRWS